MQPLRKGKTKSEKHHWWPNCVSQHWKNSEGKVNWLKPDGSIVTAPPKKFGALGNGHFIKLSKNPEDITPWDQNFEPIFNKADDGFPSVVTFLQSLKRKNILDAKNLSDRFIPQNVSDTQIAQIVESIVSLAIRSPIQRETAVGVAETIQGRGKLPERERNAIIGLNMRDSQERAVSQIGTRGKFAVLYSPEREFIFGDGFFHNIRSPVQYQVNNYKLLVPITPEISVLYASPRQYMIEPRFFTFVLSPNETDILNEVIQIYSCRFLFYRNEKPNILSDYKEGTHKTYSDQNNPVDTLISAIPGVRSDDHFFF